MKADLIVTDMDGTAVQYPIGVFSSSWDTLAEILSEDEKKQWFSHFENYHGKTELYFEWFNKQVGLLKGKKLSDAEKFLFPIPYSKGFREFFSNSKELKKAILSAGIDIVARKIAEEFSFDYWIAQEVCVERGVFNGKGISFKNGQDKSKLLFEIMQRFDVNRSRTCYVGDTGNDISCLEIVDIPVAFNPTHGLEEYVKLKKIPCIYDFHELKEILEN